MKRRKKLSYYLLFFTFSLLLYISPTYAQDKLELNCTQKFPASKCVSNWQQMLPELHKAQVVYLGETHDSEIDHQNQLKIIQELHKKNQKIAIAMEMFQAPYQGIVNQYLAGKITEAQLIEKSEYNQRWGFPWEYYAPMLRFAKEKGLPVLALNTPSEVTRKVARQGLSSLTPAERKFIPPMKEIRTDNQEYRQLALAAFRQHQAGGHGNSASADRFFTAQVLWDETMAMGIAKFVEAKPNYQVVVLAGQGHVVYGYGIPSRVKRRLKGIKQRSVLLSMPSGMTAKKEKAIADFIYERKTPTTQAK
ncbi:MAG: ChaN family lipoprotein [Calothrix sp. MO_167.B42]|nr:ChaN family lipoprotein [Calothrix sp. MO_167.B42]